MRLTEFIAARVKSIMRKKNQKCLQQTHTHTPIHVDPPHSCIGTIAYALYVLMNDDSLLHLLLLSEMKLPRPITVPNTDEFDKYVHYSVVCVHLTSDRAIVCMYNSQSASSAASLFVFIDRIWYNVLEIYSVRHMHAIKTQTE